MLELIVAAEPITRAPRDAAGWAALLDVHALPVLAETAALIEDMRANEDVADAHLLAQTIAFALFRLFDAAKPGPVGWADRCFKPRSGATGEARIGWREGLGIMLDDLVAALCTLLVIALWRFVFA